MSSDVPTSNPGRVVTPEGFSANIALARRIAERYAFGFHIANGTVSEYRGWKSEDRDATEEELELWRFVELRYHESGGR